MARPGDRVEQLYVFCVTDDHDIEGLAMLETEMGLVPMIAADTERAEQLKAYAERMARDSGDTLKLYHFTNRDELETFCG